MTQQGAQAGNTFNAANSTPGGPPQRPLPTVPRTVRGGVKLHGKEAPRVDHWAGRRVLGFMHASAESETTIKALAWAIRGQTRSLTFEAGEIVASIQGLEVRPHRVSIPLTRFTPEQWERIVSAVNDSATHSARLMAREMPEEIEEVFGQVGVSLFPKTSEDFSPRCSCKDPASSATGWCIHSCVAGFIAAERLSEDPFLIFTLRGLPSGEFIERLRQRRAATRAARGFAPAYAPRTPPGVPANAPSLDSDLDQFWAEPDGLDEIDMTPRKAEVTHPLLRRLGPTPFAKGKFPLVGLLATCYDIASEAAVREGDPVLPDHCLDSDDDDATSDGA